LLEEVDIEVRILHIGMVRGNAYVRPKS
jgi:hypothetical protein